MNPLYDNIPLLGVNLSLSISSTFSFSDSLLDCIVTMDRIECHSVSMNGRATCTEALSIPIVRQTLISNTINQLRELSLTPATSIYNIKSVNMLDQNPKCSIFTILHSPKNNILDLFAGAAGNQLRDQVFQYFNFRLFINNLYQDEYLPDLQHLHHQRSISLRYTTFNYLLSLPRTITGIDVNSSFIFNWNFSNDQLKWVFLDWYETISTSDIPNQAIIPLIFLIIASVCIGHPALDMLTTLFSHRCQHPVNLEVRLALTQTGDITTIYKPVSLSSSSHPSSLVHRSRHARSYHRTSFIMPSTLTLIQFATLAPFFGSPENFHPTQQERGDNLDIFAEMIELVIQYKINSLLDAPG